MKNKFLTICGIILLFNQCKEKECNKNLILKNLSNQLVVMALPLYNGNRCGYDTTEIEANSYHIIVQRYCWENSYFPDGNYHFFVLDTLNYPKDFGPYDLIQCDSIYQKFRVLKEYKLTLEDLQKNNFIINYP
jgi:hypothetical protein